MNKPTIIFNTIGRLGNQFFIFAAFLYVQLKYKDLVDVFLYLDDDLKYDHSDYIDNRLFDKFKDYILDKLPYSYKEIHDKHNGVTLDDTSNLDHIVEYAMKINEPLLCKMVMNQTSKFYLQYKDEIDKYFLFDVDYKIDPNNSVFISIRRGDYIPFYYVMNINFYIDMYNRYFEGKDIYISSDDIDWVRQNIDISKLNGCKNITYIENKASLEILNIAREFKNFICSNSTFSAMCSLFSKYDYNDKLVVGVLQQKKAIYRYTIYGPLAIYIDVCNKENMKYLDPISTTEI